MELGGGGRMWRPAARWGRLSHALATRPLVAAVSSCAQAMRSGQSGLEKVGAVCLPRGVEAGQVLLRRWRRPHLSISRMRDGRLGRARRQKP